MSEPGWSIEAAAGHMFKEALPASLYVYKNLLKHFPHPEPLSDRRVKEIGGGALLFLLYARLADPEAGVGAEPGLDRAIASLKQDPTLDSELVKNSVEVFDRMWRYKIIREGASIWEWLVERVLYVSYPSETLQVPSALHGFLKVLGDEYGLLKSKTLQ